MTTQQNQEMKNQRVLLNADIALRLFLASSVPTIKNMLNVLGAINHSQTES